MRVAVIVVSYNTREMLRTCLRSVLASTLPDIELEVVVVDNGSTDESAAMVRADFPQVQLHVSHGNLGFTGANNLALGTLGLEERSEQAAARLSRPGDGTLAVNPAPSTPAARAPDYVLLLNPDAMMAPDALAELVACLEQRPQAGACGARLEYGDGRFQHGAFRWPSVAQIAIDLFPMPHLPGWHRLADSRFNGRYSLATWFQWDPFPVDFVLGATLMVRWDVVRQVGELDDGFFMYCEEVDWCLRMHQAGWGVYAVPTAHVVHFQGQSSLQARWVNFGRLWRSRLRFFRKHHDRYGVGDRLAITFLLWGSLLARRRHAYDKFARGELSGIAWAAESDAYNRLLAHLRSFLAPPPTAEPSVPGSGDEKGW